MTATAAFLEYSDNGHRYPALSHGHARKGKKTRTYRIWCGMKSRCSNPHEINYERYGGRGIAVCDRWAKFEYFLDDMGECPNGLTLERKDNNLNYGPENCVWASPTDQANNRRSNHRYVFNGKNLTVAEISRKCGIRQDTLGARLLRGWSMDRATMEPVGLTGKGVYVR